MFCANTFCKCRTFEIRKVWRKESDCWPLSGRNLRTPTSAPSLRCIFSHSKGVLRRLGRIRKCESSSRFFKAHAIFWAKDKHATSKVRLECLIMKVWSRNGHLSYANCLTYILWPAVMLPVGTKRLWQWPCCIERWRSKEAVDWKPNLDTQA